MHKRKAESWPPSGRTKSVKDGATRTDTSETRLEIPKDQKARDQHFSQLYSEKQDFQKLAQFDPEFGELWNLDKTDFFDKPRCVMQLTKALLKRDFDLNIALPEDRLCPPVTNRHNYILWIKSLLDTTSYAQPGREAVGLDIGTGASCIYPLLGCAQRPWTFIATDIDEKNLEYASQNVTLNNLQHRIDIVPQKTTDPLIPIDDLGIKTLDFVMNNPPFYKSEEEMAKSASEKSRPPFSACTGALVEMVTDGGEVAFVDRIFRESLVLRERVQWYTAMFGFRTSLVAFVAKLREKGVDNYAVTEFVQGSKTRRWAVAWSFGGMRPSLEVARGIKTAVAKNVLPDMTEATVIAWIWPERVGEFAEALRAAVSKLELISWEWDAALREGVGRAGDKVWSRAWRRERERELESEELPAAPSDASKKKCVFAFKVSICLGKSSEGSAKCRWIEGHDALAFESFRGYLRTTALSILKGRA